jgi:Cu/Ag efflux protein CusF
MTRAILITFIIAMGVVACGSGGTPPAEETTPASGAESQAEPERYRGRGIVEAIDVAEGQVTLNHGDIPGFMNAMTMTFDVKPPSQLENLTVGMEVDFTVVVDADGAYYIGQIGPLEPR